MRKKKIKILHVAQAAGGVDRYIRMLLKYLDVSNFSKDKGTESIPNTSHRAQNSVFGQRFS